MKLDQNISELLFKYDCVIVPDLGGFVTNYNPASLDERSKTFSPPSKSLGFNSYLKNNDGLLAKYIAEKEKLGFEEVSADIKKEVEDYFKKLNNGKRIVFDKVGILYMDNAKNIQFSPDESINYLLDSYGLRSVFAHPSEVKEVNKRRNRIVREPVLEEKVVEKKETVIIDMPSEEIEIEGLDDALKRRIWRVAAVIIPFTIFLGYLVTEPTKSGDTYLSDINPFKDSIVQEYQPREIEVNAPEVSMVSDFPDLFDLPSDQVSINVSLVEADKTGIPVRLIDRPVNPAIKKENLTVAVESTFVAPKSISQLRYHIIAGCFGELRNAQKQVKRLRKNGFKAYIIDKRRGLHRVVYGSYANRNEALILLQQVKQNEDSKAWLMKK